LLNIAALKKSAISEVDRHYESLADLSRQIHDDPEVAFEEHRSSARLIDFLAKAGFKTEKGICGLATAFRADHGRGRPVVAFLAEYDALPGIGHGCGHNLIATCSVAAALALKKVVADAGGTVTVFGTPAEELYGGKSIMADAGAFTDVDIAMIVHPGGGNRVLMNTLACETLKVEFTGVSAHAAGAPELGINALEALIQSYNAVNSLRQHIGARERISGVITDGGQAANVIPAHAAATFIVRAVDDTRLDKLKERVINCFTGAATATGAKLKYSWGERYAAMVSNVALGRLFRENMQTLGHSIRLGENEVMNFSTDVGNVSQLVPTIQPLVAISSAGASIHTPEFCRIAATDDAVRRILDAAKAMAMTAIDLLVSPLLMEQVQQEFRRGR
jgi:amidohydrolase